jgi:hypothetical protein
MPAGWDQWLVYLIVAAAALYVARGFFSRRRSACGGCSGCPAAEKSPRPAVSDLVQIEPARPRPPDASASRRET